MINCPNCGTSTIDAATYCPKCGSFLQRKPQDASLGWRVFGAIAATFGFLILGAVGACFGGVFGSAIGDAGIWMGAVGAVIVVGCLWGLSLRAIFRKRSD